MRFLPRDYQRAMIAHVRRHKRPALWASMGTGKSVSALTGLIEADSMEPVFPILICGPLRVVQSVWPDEIRKWDHLSHLTVSVVTGTAAERKRALAAKADVYCVNFENIPWLVEHLAGDWPFKTVIADEATKLKGFRMTQGTQRARALASVAHAKTDRFIELTGTPASNGIADLWGQVWYLDTGVRLGRTYTAFCQRWFRPTADGFGMEPLPFAQEEIQERLADLCLSIEAKDFLDLPPLVENIIHVDLPPQARALYRDMERQMLLEISGQEVEAFNAAARTNKCLQLAAGAIYTDDKGAWEEVHCAKLDALESVVEEAAGNPILVAYLFRSDLARILKRFGKRARHLDKDPQTIRDFNAGKIPVLVAHPQSCGHGINLADGGHILAYFSSGWSLEEDMQILERLGPTRQYQAGHKRTVYVHRIVARNTVDELVAVRRQTKADVQQILLDYMKRRGNDVS
jgi:SNF2 family DNA or RNA helicase